jgi:hypothetical protein
VGAEGRTEGRKDTVYTVMVYVVASYDTGGITNVSEGHAGSIFGFGELRSGTRPS